MKIWAFVLDQLLHGIKVKVTDFIDGQIITTICVTPIARDIITMPLKCFVSNYELFRTGNPVVGISLQLDESNTRFYMLSRSCLPWFGF